MGIAQSVTASDGEENLFLFGLTAEQVEGSGGWCNPRWHYENESETRAALDLIAAPLPSMPRRFGTPNHF
jgi:starch phosphorylase